MVNGNKSGENFKSLLICCVLGKYDPSYSCLFYSSYATVEIDFQYVKYLFQFLLLRNEETYKTLHMSFLNYLLIVKAKPGDLCIIIIIIVFSFSKFFTLRIM